MVGAVWVYTLVPATLAVIAAAITIRVRPGPVLVSTIQHFAAGVVFAAAAGEVLPDVVHGASPLATLVGGAAGIVAMLAIKQVETLVKGALGLLIMIGIDLLVDGMVLGIGFSAGAKTGFLLMIALSLEVVFLAMALSTGLSKSANSPAKIVAITAVLMVLLPVGAILAAPVGAMPSEFSTGFLTFGLIALLYLVTEELLVEAHQTPDRPWVTAMFFVGFMMLLLLEEIMT
ncbi:Metal transporter, ZIP family [hydrothermal vent metagenome]|uniref:Metal transporter, ZIP family n=1 Tax=hydrothermal vent metagenome TaxID=652676 RepID=A0A3B0U0K6_9ZZZZ